MSKPTLALIPSGYKSGKVYSILPNDASGDFDFTRQSIGTRVRKDGLIEEAKTDGSITNLQIRSEEFDNSAWIKSDISVTANDTLAPNGTNTADAIVEGTGTGGKIIYDTSATSVGVYTFSVYIKKEDKRYTAIQVSGSTTTSMFNVDLDNGTGEVVAGSFDETNIETLANDWYRVSVTFTAASGTLNNQIYLMNGSAYANRNYTGNGTDKNYVWGAMLSVGALSDYIKTEGSQVTKTVETFTDVPRLDWLNSNCPSLKLEPQRTNLFGYSEEYDQPSTYWTKTRFTISANTIISPNGTLTADEVFETVDNNNRFLYQNISVTSGNDYTISFFVKYNNIQYLQLASSTGFSGSEYVNFDIINGTITKNFYNTVASIEQYSNGWFRISMTETSSTTTTGRMVLASIPSGTSNRLAGYIGNTSNSFYIWGGQMEQGSYPTSYIKTEGSTVTRLKDECLNGGDSDLFDITEGTFFVDATNFEGTETHIGLSAGNDANKIAFIYKANGYQLRIYVSSSSVVSLDTTQTILDAQRNKVALTFKQNEFKVFINGTLVHTDTSGNIPLNFSRLDFANRTGTGAFFEGKVHDTRVYDRVLTEAEAIELTT